MSKSCTILAHVRNSNGEIVESRLFNDLLHYTSNNREIAKEYYAVGTDEEFLSMVRDSEEFQTDENGEITFKSLRSLAKIDLETDKVLQVLNEDIGEGIHSYDDAIRRIQEFNTNNGWADKMLATMVYVSKDKYYVSVVPKVKTVTDIEGRKEVVGNTATEQQKLHDTVRDRELERRLIGILKQHKVSVKFIEDAEEGGRYSTVNAVQMENGLFGLIEVNENGTTTDVLAEEAGHFAVGALGDNPLVKRLENLLSSAAAQREALGEEEYANSNLGSRPAREVAGRLVGRALLRKLGNDAPFKVIANRIANLAKRVFYNFTGNEVRWAAAKAEQMANKIAYQFAEGNSNFSVQNAISYPEIMRHNADLKTNQKVFRDTVDELGRMVKKLEAIADDKFAGMAKASLALTVMAGTDEVSGESAYQKSGVFAESLAFDGIVQAFVQLTDYLGPGKEVDQLMKAVNLKNPSEFYANMAMNGRCLRQARTFLRSAEIIANTIRIALNDNNLGGTITVPNGVDLHAVRYQDEDGNWKTINLSQALTAYSHLIYDMEIELNALESSYFARFCEDIYGSKYITSTAGVLWSDIWNNKKSEGEKTISIANMVDGYGTEDIDVFHRFLGPMSNNPDVIGQIADKLVKTANKTADDIALQYQERLIILQDRAKKLGLNLDDLAERDANGVVTGNMVTPPARPTEEGFREEDFIYETYMEEINQGRVPYTETQCMDNGRWEAARDAFKKQAWEDFKAANPTWESMSGFTRGYLWDAFMRPRMKKWNDANSLKVVVKSPAGSTKYVKWVPNFTYVSDAWDKLKAKYPNKNGDSLDQWVHDYMKIKEELDSMLPVGATISYRLPQFRGTFINAIKNSMPLENKARGINATRKTIGRRGILERFGVESEETDYGCLHTMNSSDEELLGTKLDYELEKAQRLPIFGINKMKDMRDLSTDLLHSMLAYASMATSYSCLDNVIDGLEVGREVLYNRKFTEKRIDAPIVDPITGVVTKVGSRFKKAKGAYETLETGSKNMAYGRYVKFLDAQVYGISATHWGITLKNGKRLLLSKLIQNISSLGGALYLKGNVIGGGVNSITGFNNVFKEAITGDYFNAEDWAAAHAYYFKYLPIIWTVENSKLRKSNRLSLFLDQMNSQNSNRTRARNWKAERNRFENFLQNVWYLPYSSGDHYMQAMSYLAVAHGLKLYDTDGTEKTNLWNAFNRVDNTDEHNAHSKGKALEFKRLCPLNSNEITTDALDSKGVFLKPVTKSTVDFEGWLLVQDPNFADEAYKSSHAVDYINYRSQYDNLSTKDLMKFKADRYRVLTGILQKVEDYLSGVKASPLTSVPSFSTEEQQYLSLKKVSAANYADILQVVRDDIYSIIWTKADESSYMDKCREVNIRLHGIYNEQDKTAWHHNWYTNAFLSMKGWCLGYLEYLYSNNHYSIALGKHVEGVVNTAFKVPMSVIVKAFKNADNLKLRSLWEGYKKSDGLSIGDMLLSMIIPWTNRSMKAMKEAGFSEEQNYNMRRWVMSWLIIGMLRVLKIATAAPDKDEDEEINPTTGFIYYFAMRALLEQEAFLYIPELFNQKGQVLDLVPIGFSALFDLYKLGEEFVGSLTHDKESEYFYQQDAKNGAYEEGDPKWERHALRFIPYAKNFPAFRDMYSASENYEFGRKLATR